MLSVIIEHFYWIKLIKKGGSEYGLINGFIKFMGCFLNKTDEKGGLLRLYFSMRHTVNIPTCFTKYFLFVNIILILHQIITNEAKNI